MSAWRCFNHIFLQSLYRLAKLGRSPRSINLTFHDAFQLAAESSAVQDLGYPLFSFQHPEISLQDIGSSPLLGRRGRDTFHVGGCALHRAKWPTGFLCIHWRKGGRTKDRFRIKLQNMNYSMVVVLSGVSQLRPPCMYYACANITGSGWGCNELQVQGSGCTDYVLYIRVWCCYVLVTHSIKDTICQHEEHLSVLFSVLPRLCSSKKDASSTKIFQTTEGTSDSVYKLGSVRAWFRRPL